MNLKKDYKKPQDTFFFFFFSERKKLGFEWKCRLVSIVERSKHHYRSRKIKAHQKIKRNCYEFNLVNWGVYFKSPNFNCTFIIRFNCLFEILFMLRVHPYSKSSKVKEANHLGKVRIPFFCFKDNSWHRNLNILIW